MCLDVLTACMSVQHMHACCLQSSEERVGFPGAEITDDYKLSCGFWE